MHTSDAPLPRLLPLSPRENEVHVDSSRSDSLGLAVVTALQGLVYIVSLTGSVALSRYL
jgi:hypothetical protein